jgi:RND superfamily putative drug exporter
MQKLAALAVRRRWFVLAAWLIAILGAQAISSAIGGADYRNDFKLPHTETATVSALLKSSGLDVQNGATGTMVIHATSATVPDKRAVIEPALATLCALPDGVAVITSPYGRLSCSPSGSADRSSGSPQGSADLSDVLSADRTIGLVGINFSQAQPTQPQIQDVYDHLKALRSPGLQVEFTGNAFQQLAQNVGGIPPEVFGFIAALLILLVVFRTFGATVLPLLSAVAALGSGLALLAILSQIMPVADFATQLATLMTLGVGIDYALFIVTRHRRNLMRGMSIDESIVLAINTSGRAVLFAGITVCIALLGLCALSVSFLYGVAIGTAIAVALTMLASLTLLPAMLRFLGLKVLPRRHRREVRAGRFSAEVRHGFWYRWSGIVQRQRTVVGLLALVILAVLAVPFFSMRLGSSDQSTDPSSSTTRKGYDLIAQGFGRGFNSTLELVVSGPQAADPAYLARLTAALKAVPNVAPATIRPIPAGPRIAFVSFKSQTSPQDVRTTALVKHLRNTVVPTMTAGTPNHVYVYGATAIFVDFAKVLAAKMPLFFTAVIGLSFLLLMIAFRSIVVPITAAAMNLLAAGAAFGIVVAIFQWGWLSGPLGTGGSGPIEPFIPVMFFAILFGLSMDYQVFLVSRMHEEWVHTDDNTRAITVGQSETGGIITAAAMIMISVFGGFILGDQRVIKLFGVGLAGAIFLDAFVVRTLLVPSLMHLFGRANWWYPAWLDRLTPQVSIEAAEEDVPATSGDDPDEAFARV